ncbi:hypothetical protein GCM10011391_10220 [Pullulanibacillus camelliae]|uniref:beta-N-acetylhexosaminidase n=1 Tax=Pullulanibacillus camelliae TaxID=1707096 RepID=A0A8J2VJX5_9BACL|nr:beta-N-acetylhexosaminidase [Pullulanibacillus camelliae]GGE33503.1 hypothetical protein GCM10011391_10220 [Pullulanibacillus camelliae]
MKKSLVTSFCLILFSVYLVGCGNKGMTPPDKDSEHSQQDSDVKAKSVNDLIRKIKEAAAKGRVMKADIVAGKSMIQEVQTDWGNPSSQTQTSTGLYADYKKQKVAVGYFRQTPIFDVRSYASALHDIRLSDIKKQLGSPDGTHYYKDKQVDQQILTYTINQTYQLKWILPRPTSANRDPRVDHLSVYDKAIAEQSIPAKLQGMTLDEKIGQMLMVGVTGTTIGANEKQFIKEQHVGGVILYGKNIKSAAQTVQLINALKTVNKDAQNPFPLFISVDQEGGSVERLPSTVKSLPSGEAIGKRNNQAYSNRIGQLIGKELKAFGFNMDFAPVLDIKQSSHSAIGNRAFGSDKKTVGQLGVATMKGIQSQQVISVIKHFPGYGSVTVDAHADLPAITYGKGQLEAVDWWPYKQAIAKGADIVMVTHLKVPQIDTHYPASMSRPLITDMLRTDLNFHGVVITDDMTMGAITKHYPVDQAAVQSVKAGADIVLIAYNKSEQLKAIQALKQAVKSGAISMNRIDDSVYRILRLKENYHLSDQLQSSVDVHALNQSIQEALTPS